MARMRLLCALAVGAVLLAACSSSDKKTVVPTTTTIGSTATTTTSVASTTTSTAATATTTTTVHSTNTSVKINSFATVGTSNPVSCNAPTMIELKWSTSGASKVTLSIDGPGIFGTYPAGAHDSLFPLACDGHTHTYTLTASANGAVATKTISVGTKSS
jgi:hypothetical protein